jgi:hypothetical protein
MPAMAAIQVREFINGMALGQERTSVSFGI